MSQSQAIALLAACKPLSRRLFMMGVKEYKLTEQDMIDLQNFEAVRQAGFGAKEEIRRMAGLMTVDMVLLGAALEKLGVAKYN